MPGRHHRYSDRALEVCPPFALVVHDKLEHPVAVWCAEGDFVFTGFTSDGRKRSADVGIEHRELELEVRQPRVGLKGARGGIETRNVRGVHLSSLIRGDHDKGKETYNLVVGSVVFFRLGFIDQMMSRFVNTENQGLLECPGRKIACKLSVTRFSTGK